MKKSLLGMLVALGLVAPLCEAKEPIKIPLGSGEEAAVLYVYPAEKSSGVALVACPGGGYVIKAKDHEGFDFADELNNKGITYGVVDYRLPKQKQNSGHSHNRILTSL